MTERYTVPVRGEKRVRKHSLCRHRTRRNGFGNLSIGRQQYTRRAGAQVKPLHFAIVGGGGNTEPAGSMQDIYATLHMLVLLGGSIALTDLGCDLDL